LQHIPPQSGQSADMLACPLCADFVAEVRCKIFWWVIPSL